VSRCWVKCISSMLAISLILFASLTLTASLIVASFLPATTTYAQTVSPLDRPIGWASEAGGTTGGGNAAPVIVTSASELQNLVKDNTPRVIYVQGNIGGNYTAGSNKTIIGLPGATTGSWTFKGSSNVILRNLKIRGNGADGDAVTVTDYSHHIWFDHLDLADSTDENLSIKRGSDYITISWCKYWFSRDGGHTFGGLIGHSDNNAAQDEGRLRVTYHHNWYSKGVTERMPRVRFGKVHIFNNLFDAPGNNYVIRCGYKANIRSEGNVFVNMKNCFDFSTSSPDSVLQSINDLFIGNCSGTTGRGIAFVPPYQYTVEPTAGLKEKIEAGAGATLNVPGTFSPTPSPSNTPTATPTPASIVYGDLNNDGRTNSTDYSLMKRYLLGSISFTNEQLKAADVNLDGKVNSSDYTVLRRFLLGSIDLLPYNGTATYQAEDAVFSGAIFETKNAGYTGTGYVNYDNVPGGYIEWTLNIVNAGTYTLTLTYANGTSSNRTVDISVNGNIVASGVVFGGTGSWTQWQTKSITASLNSGVNKIRVTGTSSDGGPNIDKLEIRRN